MAFFSSSEVMVTSTTSCREGREVGICNANRPAEPMGYQESLLDPAMHLPLGYLQVIGDVVDRVENLCPGLRSSEMRPPAAGQGS